MGITSRAFPLGKRLSSVVTTLLTTWRRRKLQEPIRRRSRYLRPIRVFPTRKVGSYRAGMSGNTEELRSKLAEAARDILAGETVGALAKLVTRKRCAEAIGSTHPTTNRAVPSGEELIALAADRVLNDDEWGGYDEAVDAILMAFQGVLFDDNGVDTADVIPARERALHQTLKLNYEYQFRSPGTPAGWFLTAAALTGSDQWEGPRPIGDQARLCEEILALRRAQYGRISEHFEMWLDIAMSRLELVPRPGFDKHTIVVLLHCLYDGAVLRRFFDPEAVDADLVATAMLELGKALGQRGSVDDPRLPQAGSDAVDAFHELVTCAAGMSARDVSVSGVAEMVRWPTSTAAALFHTDGDLLDSVLRRKIVGSGLDVAKGSDVPGAFVGVMLSQLDNLATVASDTPQLLERAEALPPTQSAPLREDMVRTIGVTLQSLQPPVPSPAATAVELVDYGWRGQLSVVRSILVAAGVISEAESRLVKEG